LFPDPTARAVHDNVSSLSEPARLYRTGIVSNFYGDPATACDDLGIRSFFQAIVDSQAVGWTKPDPRILRHALDELGVKPAEETFVGDSLSRDMAGARSVGMAHIWLVPAAAADPRPCCRAARVIRSLRELGGMLP